MKSEVARGEIELLVVCGVVRNVHFAVLTGNGAVAFNHNGGIVVESGGSTLEEGGDDDDAKFLCQSSESFSGGTWNGLCQIKQSRVLRLAEVE